MPIRSVELFTAVLAAVLGWVGTGVLLLGPTYSSATTSIDPAGTTGAAAGTSSLLEVGVSPLTAAVLVLAVLAFALLVVGAWRHRSGERGAHWLVALGALVPAAITLVSFGASSFLLPGAALGVVTAVLAWTPTAVGDGG